MDCCLHRIVPGATEPLSAPSSSSTFKEGAKTLLNVIKSLPILTLPSIDQEGLTVQLFKLKNYGMIGAVIQPDGETVIISKKKIHSPLCPEISCDDLMNRLETAAARRWALVYRAEKREIIILPYLKAEARFLNQEIKQGKASPVVHLTREQLRQSYLDRGYKLLYKHTDAQSDYETYTDGRFVHVIDHRNQYNEAPHIDVYRNRKHEFFKKYPPHPDVLKKAEQLKARFAYKADCSPISDPRKGQFNEKLQKTGLTDSYNAVHQDNPAPKGAGGGQIGGVGCTVEYIKGLFDSPESLFDSEHAFFVPAVPGEPLPFSNQQLHQILQELAIGIYVHNTVPFFSLHFNEEGQLYPVIHPAYEKTLVGQVFSMLDYFMKGYVNGGVFKEDFIYHWVNRPDKIEANESTLKELVNFKNYTQKMLQGGDAEYISLRLMIKAIERGVISGLASRTEVAVQRIINPDHASDEQLFRDYTQFTNSSRIIARQVGIEKAGNLFVLKGDFDALYTIEPNPEYQLALEQYFKIHGVYPPGYDELTQAYKVFMNKIHDHMIKLPMCRKYFSMLNVISFFSYYFMTLKKHQKYPILPQVEEASRGCPSLFPSLPLLSVRKEDLKFNANKFMEKIVSQHGAQLIQFIKTNQDLTQQFKQQVEVTAKLEIWNQFYRGVSKPMQREMEQEQQYFEGLCQQFAAAQLSVLDDIKSSFMLFEAQAEEEANKKYGQVKYRFDKDKMIENFINVVLIQILPDEDQKIMEINANQFILPSEQSPDEIKKGMSVVGGCGMSMNPLTVELSTLGEAVLEEVGIEILNNPPGSWIEVQGEEGRVPKGAIFSLLYDDIPPDAIGDNLKMENLLTHSTGMPPEELRQMNRILQAISEDDWNQFLALIEGKNLVQMKDREGRTLLHHTAGLDDLRYTGKLIQDNLSVVQGDALGYTPLHYAAAAGKINQLDKLLQTRRGALEIKNNQGATPLITAIQNGHAPAVNLLLERGAKGDVRLVDGYTTVHCAAHQGDLSILNSVLDKSAEARALVNEATQEGVTPLMLACQAGLPLVKKMVEMGANPRLKAKNGTTALDRAVAKNEFEICQFLLEGSIFSPFTVDKAIKKCSLVINKMLATKPEYVQYRNKIEDTPLIMALRYANIPLAMHILNTFGAAVNLNAKNKLDETAVDLAGRSGLYAILEELIARGATADRKSLAQLLLKTGYKGNRPHLNAYLAQQPLTANELKELLLTAAEAGNHVAITDYLLPLGVNLDALNGANGWKIEHYLARSDGIFLMRQRLTGPQDFLMRLPDGGKTLAYIAGENRSLRVLSFLLDRLIERNIALESHYHHRHLLWCVLEIGSVEGVKLFVEKLKDPNLLNIALDETGRCAAHVAASVGSVLLLEYLHSQGANFSLTDKHGRSPLTEAISGSKEEAAAYLLENGLGVDMSASSLFEASGLEDDKLFNFLTSRGASLDAKESTDENTPLIMAILANHPLAFSRLLEKGASLSIRNREGWSPFLLACREGQAIFAAMLLSRLNPAERQVRIKGNNALHIATIHGHGDCIRLLLDHGFLPDDVNGGGKKAAHLATKWDALAALKISPHREQYEGCSHAIQQAILNQDIGPILSQIAHWPVNAYFSAYRPLIGPPLKGTMLHLLLSSCSRCKLLKELVKRIHDRADFDPSLKDQYGLSYSHLIVQTEIDLDGLDKFDYEVIDSKGLSPLHYAVTPFSETALFQLIQRLGPQRLDPVDRKGMTPLCYSVKDDKKRHLKLLVEAGADVNRGTSEGITPLTLACFKGNEPMVRYLIKHGAAVNSNNQILPFDPLAVSLQQKQEGIALYLLSCGADAGKTDENGVSLVHFAAQTGLNGVIRCLDAKGLSINSPDSNGKRPIHYAAAAGKTKTIALLESLGVDIEVKTFASGYGGTSGSLFEATPLQLASLSGTPESVKWLLDRGANPENCGDERKNILAFSLMNTPGNSRELLKQFEKYRLSDHLNQLYPAIGTAIAGDRVDSLQSLFEMGIPIDANLEQGYTPLHLACLKGAVDCTAFLFAKGADPYRLTKEGEAPMQLAAANPSVEQFRLMLQHINPDLDRKYQRGETLLHVAARSDRFSHACLLIDKGADFDSLDDQGQTPLFIAAQKGYKPLAELLMICGANPNIGASLNGALPEDIAKPEIAAMIQVYRTKWVVAPPGTTPLHMAVRSTHLLAVKLTARHFDIDGRDETGATPILIATQLGDVRAIQALLDHSPDLSIKNKAGWTPLGLACLEVKDLTVAHLLCQAGADPNGLEAGGKTLRELVNEVGWGVPFIRLFDKWQERREKS